jgi:hypothetical protein
VNSWLLGILARGLEPSERQAVLGDIAESGEGIFPALRDLLGLIIRRQAALWAHWQPWLALIGIGVIAGASLSRIAGGFTGGAFQQWRTYEKYGAHYATGLTPRQDFAFLACLAAGLIVWSWTSGFLLQSLSGRAAWLTWLVFCLVALDLHLFLFPAICGVFLGTRRRALPMRYAYVLINASIVLQILAMWIISAWHATGQQTWLIMCLAILDLHLFLLPALAGAFFGARRRVLPVRYAYILGAAVMILAILATWMNGWYVTAEENWSRGAWHGGSRATLQFLLVSWPAFYLLIHAARQQTNEVTTK